MDNNSLAKSPKHRKKEVQYAPVDVQDMPEKKSSDEPFLAKMYRWWNFFLDYIYNAFLYVIPIFFERRNGSPPRANMELKETPIDSQDVNATHSQRELNTTIELEEPIHSQLSLVTVSKPNTIDTPDAFSTKTDVESKVPSFKKTRSYNFKNTEETKIFLAKVNEFITNDEAQVVPAKTKYSNLFISQLNPIKEKGKHSLSELDSLWDDFNGFESEPSQREHKSQKFAMILIALSEEQLKAAFDSPDFLRILNKDSYVAAAASALNRKQLALFAADITKHEILNSMIKKLKPDPYLLGKLASIMPNATVQVRSALIDQIAHLAHPASFKVEMAKLAEHYVAINTEQMHKKYSTIRPRAATTGSKPQPSKWATVRANINPIYKAIPVKKQEWTDETFKTFIHDLNEPTYLIHEKQLIEDINYLPDSRIKMLVERAALPEFKSLLNHFWFIESKPLNHNSYIENRANRLKITLEHLSEAQLKSSIKEIKFWEIFRNTLDPYCGIAAQVFSPQQFVTVITQAPIERHADFAVLITRLKKDSKADKERLQQILEAIIPYTSPWLALIIEQHIKSLFARDNPLLHRFNADLKKFLKESLERPEVNLNYQKDTNLNKKAITRLLTESDENSYTHAFAFK
jgi:hypothetical protein